MRLINKQIIEFSKHELLIINNALNEVLNGLEVPEFKTRIGATEEEVKELLAQIASVLAEQ